MVNRVVIVLGLLAAALPAAAETTSPFFGSSTQTPVTIAVNPETGLPVVAQETGEPAIALAQ